MEIPKEVVVAQLMMRLPLLPLRDWRVMAVAAWSLKMRFRPLPLNQLRVMVVVRLSMTMFLPRRLPLTLQALHPRRLLLVMVVVGK